jgi:RND family efflux transporter MFP subunit
MMDDLARSGTPQALVPILAPIRGTVVEKNVVEGMRVEPGSTLFTLADLSHVWVEARLTEEDGGRLGVDDPVTLSLPADPSWTAAARVWQVVPQIDVDTRTRLIRIAVDNANSRLVPGAWVDVRFDVAAEKGLIIPVDAILETGMRRIVYVKESGNHYAAREVEVGLRSTDEALITSGVAEGDSVVATAAFLVDSESRLRPVHTHS